MQISGTTTFLKIIRCVDGNGGNVGSFLVYSIEYKLIRIVENCVVTVLYYSLHPSILIYLIEQQYELLLTI